MKRFVKFSVLACALLFAPTYAAIGAELRAVPTFHSVGLYWTPVGGGSGVPCYVRYRVAGTQAWRAALNLWFDARNGEYRGSVVSLSSGTTYEIQGALPTGHVSTVSVTTWSERFPIGRTVRLPANLSETLVVDESGTADGYVLYAPEPGRTTTIDVSDQDNNCVRIEAHHVIVRGLDIRNASRSAVRILSDSHDVVIEENDISGWGRVNELGWGISPDAGIYAGTDASNVARVIIQRNRIHDPRGDANSWVEERIDVEPSSTGWHPTGPNGVYLYNTAGNHVFRYNHIYSSDHKYNDGFGGGADGSTIGNPHTDSDIYGNEIEDVWDDAIQAEGANRNVRIWGNYTHDTYQHIAVRGTHIGPLYVFRNVAGSSRFGVGDWDSDARGRFLKAGGDGRAYLLHNTVLQPRLSGLALAVGSSRGYSGTDFSNAYSRNNIIQVHDPAGYSFKLAATGDIDYDLYNGEVRAHPGAQSHGIFGTPVYASSNGDGEFALQPGSPGFDQGVVLANFNESFTGTAPDLGAHEAGTPGFEYGVDAYRDTTPPAAPTGLRFK